MIRMIVSSFYNTLIDKEDAIPMSTMLEIDKLRTNRIMFSICTNRDYKEVLYYNHDYPFINYIISYNGNYIYDVDKEKCIYKKALSKKIIKDIEKIFSGYNLTYYQEEDEIIKIEIKVKKKDINIIEKLNNLNISKSIFCYDKEYFIELTSLTTYDGIKKLTSLLKIKEEDIIPIIGNLSEKIIINKIDNTYVVSNAPKEMKEIAKNKTKSNNFKGVEQVIKKYNK